MPADDLEPPNVSDLHFKAAVGRRLALVREALGLSQYELAEALNLTPGAIGNYEQGKRLVPPHIAVRLKRLFGIPADWLYDGSLVAMPDDLRRRLLARGQALPHAEPPQAETV